MMNWAESQFMEGKSVMPIVELNYEHNSMSAKYDTQAYDIEDDSAWSKIMKINHGLDTSVHVAFVVLLALECVAYR